MSFPRYPAYKDSGVEWLGEVPEHWLIARFSRVIASMKDGTHGTFQRVADGLPLLSAKNIQKGRLDIGEDESLISHDDHAEIVSCGFPHRGDLLLTIVGTIGRACIYQEQEPLAFQRSVCFIRLRAEFDPGYFFHLSQSKFFQEQLAGKSKSAAQAGVYMGDVASTTVVFPSSFEEQREIAAFLDRETAKIDALIAEQERLIELLKEKRQAVISHAVTKGLDPDVPMKDSGVEWLGQVPAHWVVGQSRRYFSQRKERARESDRQLTASQKHGVIYQDDFMAIEGQRVVQVIHGADILKHVEPNDFVISMRSFQGGIEWCGHRGCVSSAYVPLVPGQGVDPGYFRNLFKSVTYIQALQSTSNLVRDGQALRFENFTKVDLPVPPVHEQALIARFVDIVVAEAAAMSNQAERAIELLTERRAALISAAVTGQIDVRGQVEAEAA